MSHRSSASRTRARRLGALGLAFSALLTPAGKIIGAAVAAAVLAGGLTSHFRQDTPPPHQDAHPPIASMQVRPAHLLPAGAAHIEVGHGDQTLHVVLSDGTIMEDTATDSAMGLPFSDPQDGDHAPNVKPVGSSTPPAAHGWPVPGVIPPTAQSAPPVPAPVGPQTIPPEAMPPKLPPTGMAPQQPGAPPAPGNTPAIPPVAAGDPVLPFDPPHKPPYHAPEAVSPTGDTLTPPGLNAPLALVEDAAPAPIPEPSILGLILLGWAAMVWTGQRLAPAQRRRKMRPSSREC